MEEVPKIPAETKHRVLSELIGQYNEMLQITMQLRQSVLNNGLTWYDEATKELLRGIGRVIIAIRIHQAEIDKELGRWQMFTFRVEVDGEIRTYAASADRKSVKIPVNVHNEKEVKQDEQDSTSETETTT